MEVSLRRIIPLIKRFIRVGRPRDWREFEYFDETWKERTALMAQLIGVNSKNVMDLGCGKCWLKDMLPTDVQYIGVDYKPREGADNIICDFNAGEFPSFIVDVVLCSGVLEYIIFLPGFVDEITAVTDQVILSYCGTDFFQDLTYRESLGWRNHFSNLGLISLFLKKDFLLAGVSLEIPGNIIAKFIKCRIK